ncbi:unnamed protein product [Didymodactylos carnosus]|uniref:Uncharacterized protein n=1 Tax=Didymodactylos carnosus TaxID=1234261 RepID=A0A813YSG3_9BILA|nr:unnamed protein product [Didymodactylos carnosus]CAF1015106.1 unnamed protein product [Didymodactylos carnosus]CAF3672966.1 unnamed protein product [Didymodactylos carnosus]CAF3784222.1 unnamed protein product [Didymodactylos carnosus]
MKCETNCTPAFSIKSLQPCAQICLPPRLCAFCVRSCHSKMFKQLYERGDLPCSILHVADGQRVKWAVVDIEKLNIDYYLPIFTDGLCETKYPYHFIAKQGILDLIERASHKIDLGTLSKMIVPLKRALYTRNSMIFRSVLLVLQKLASGNDGGIGAGLVPYFNELLPMINAFKERIQQRKSDDCRCDRVDYGQRNKLDLGRLIDETLLTLETYGGQDAFINIKFSVPTYEQQIDPKSYTTAQIFTAIQPPIGRQKETEVQTST